MDIPLPPSPSALPEPVVLAVPEPSDVEYSPSHITSDDDEKFVPSKVIEKVPPPPPPVKITMTISKPLLGQKRMSSLFKSFKSAKLGSPTPVSLDLKPTRGKLTNHLKNFDDDDNENDNTSSPTNSTLPGGATNKDQKSSNTGSVINEEKTVKGKSLPSTPQMRFPSGKALAAMAAAIAKLPQAASGARFDNMGFFVDPVAKSALEKKRLKKENFETEKKRSRLSRSRSRSRSWSSSPYRGRARSRSPDHFRGRRIKSPSRARARKRSRSSSPVNRRSRHKSESRSPRSEINNFRENRLLSESKTSSNESKSRRPIKSRSPTPEKDLALELSQLPTSWKECKKEGIDICHPGFPEAKRRLKGSTKESPEIKTFLVRRCHSPESCMDPVPCIAHREHFQDQKLDALKESSDCYYKEFPLKDVRETTTKPTIKWSMNPETSRTFDKKSDLFPQGFPPDISRMLSSGGQDDDFNSENPDIFCEGCKEKDFLSSKKTCRQKRTLKRASSSESLELNHTNDEARHSKKVSDEPAKENELGKECDVEGHMRMPDLLLPSIAKLHSVDASKIHTYPLTDQLNSVPERPQQQRVVRIGNMVQIIPSTVEPPKVFAPPPPEPIPTPIPEPVPVPVRVPVPISPVPVPEPKIITVSPVPPPLLPPKEPSANEFLLKFEELKSKIEEEHQQKKKMKISQRLQSEQKAAEKTKDFQFPEKSDVEIQVAAQEPELTNSFPVNCEFSLEKGNEIFEDIPEPPSAVDVQAINMSDREWRVRDSVRYISLKPLARKERKRQQRMMNQVDDNDSDEFVPRSPVPLPEPGKSILCSIHLTPKKTKKSVWYADGVVPGQGSPDNRDTRPVPTPKKQLKPKRYKKILLKIIEHPENSDTDVEPPSPPPGSPPRFHTQHFIDKYGKQSEVLVKLLNGTYTSRKEKS